MSRNRPLPAQGGDDRSNRDQLHRDDSTARIIDATPPYSVATRPASEPRRRRECRHQVNVGAGRSSAAHPAPVCGDPLVDTAVAVEAVVAAAVVAAAAAAAVVQSLVDSSARPIAGRTDDLGVPAPRLVGIGRRRRPWRRQARSPAMPRAGCWSPGCTRSGRRLPSGTWRWQRTPPVEGSRTGAGPGQRPAHAHETVFAAPSH